MGTTHLSRHEVVIYRLFRSQSARWLTSREAADLSGVAYRTARHHTARLAAMGVLDRSTLFPGYTFTLNARPDRTARAYRARLEQAAHIFGVS